jgi:hypothetical protein
MGGGPLQTCRRRVRRMEGDVNALEGLQVDLVTQFQIDFFWRPAPGAPAATSAKGPRWRFRRRS